MLGSVAGMNGSHFPSAIVICPSAPRSRSLFGISRVHALLCQLEDLPSVFSARNGMHYYSSKSQHSQTIPIRTLRRGKHRLFLWPGIEADGSIESATPSKWGTRDEMGRLEKVRASNTLKMR